MNISLIPLVQILATSEGEGGLFDFNATLPLMALQFVLLTIVPVSYTHLTLPTICSV